MNLLQRLIFVFKAKYHIKKYNYEKALYYVHVALEYNPESLVSNIRHLENHIFSIMTYSSFALCFFDYIFLFFQNAHFTAAKVHMLLGNWTEAMRSAEQVSYYFVS